MEKGSPVSSAFSYPWLVVLIAGAVAMLGAKLFSHQDPSLKSKGAANPPGGSGSSRVVQTDEKRDQLTSNSRKMSDEEVSEFLRGTILEKVEIVDKSLDEAVAILRKEIRKAVPNGPVAGIFWSTKSPENPPRIMEMRLKKVPLAVVIKYLCDATKCRYWIADGSVAIEAWRWMNQKEEDHFMNDSRIERLEIADASLHDAIEILRDAVDKMKFHGPRIAILIPRSEPRTKLLETGQSGDDVSDPIRVRDLKLENVSVADALREICKRTNTIYYVEEEQIFFQPIMHVPVR